MCGIVGYTGFQNSGNIVLDGLRTLEYRGYDSAGIALGGERLTVVKTAGNVDALEQKMPVNLISHTAIGHTRWATHGKPTMENAHPHLSFDGNIAVVHNGVIENCEQLKIELTRHGVPFVSETDSEIIAHMLALDSQEDMLAAIERVGKRLQGAATFLAIRKGDDSVYLLRKGASLAVGVGEGECFVASDTLALGKYVREAYVMGDGECAVLTPQKASFYKDGVEILKQSTHIKRTPPARCTCHMRAEIDEIPAALRRTYLSAVSTVDNGLLADIKRAKRILFVGCGTAYHAGLYGKLLFEKELNIPCETVLASEIDGVRFLDADSYAIFVTQSGETADTLRALEFCKSNSVRTLTITNVGSSTITFSADRTLLTDAGAEVAVAATKSYNCQLFSLYILAKMANGVENFDDIMSELCTALHTVLAADMYEDRIRTSNLFFIGKGLDSITAREGALKFKEITYKMTDTYAAGELKHGAIALIDANSTVIVIVTDTRDKHRIEATVSELRSRGAYVMAISSVGEVGADRSLALPYIRDDDLYPILSVVPLQNLALNASLCLGYDPDKPRNLAKSVTVI